MCITQPYSQLSPVQLYITCYYYSLLGSLWQHPCEAMNFYFTKFRPAPPFSVFMFSCPFKVIYSFKEQVTLLIFKYCGDQLGHLLFFHGLDWRSLDLLTASLPWLQIFTLGQPSSLSPRKILWIMNYNPKGALAFECWAGGLGGGGGLQQLKKITKGG